MTEQYFANLAHSNNSEEFIQYYCDHIIDGQSSIESIAYLLNNFIDIVGGQCLEIDYDYIIEAERQVEWDSPAVAVGYRQWSYQLCSQVIASNRANYMFCYPNYFLIRSVGSTQVEQPISHSVTDSQSSFIMLVVKLSSVTRKCEQFNFEWFVHGPFVQKSIPRFTEERLHENSDRFNILYGGLEPRVTNAVFVYGQHDPWSVIGRRTDLSEDATAIVIPREYFSCFLCRCVCVLYKAGS